MTATPLVPAAVLPTDQVTLAYDAQEPHGLVARIAASLGYRTDVGMLVGMPSGRDVLSTAQRVADVDALIRIGSLTQPRVAVLRALVDATSTLSVVRATEVAWPWVWCAPDPIDDRAVRIRKRAYADVERYLTVEGIVCELVSDYLSTEQMLEGLDAGQSVVLDRDEVPASFTFRRELSGGRPVTYGVASRTPVDDPSYFWVALEAAAETSGSLARALQLVAAHEVDLDFLFSDATPAGAHRFFLGFAGDAAQMEAVSADLGGHGFALRVLAAISATT